MEWDITIYLLPFVLSLGLAYLLLGLLLRQSGDRGVTCVTWILIGGICWTEISIVQLASRSRELILLVDQLLMLVVPLPAIAWFFFALHYTNNENWIGRPLLACVFVVPAITWVLVLTNEFHMLFWSDYRIHFDGETGLVIAASEMGPWFLVHALHLYAIWAAANVLVVYRTINSWSIFRMQTIVILVGTAIPVTLNALFLTDMTTIDYTTIGFTVTTISILWAVYRYELLELTPIDRRAAWDDLDEAIVVLDEDDHIVDVNEAAMELFDITSDPVGLSAGQFFEPVVEESVRRLEADDADTEITTRIDGEQRQLSVSISSIERYDHRDGGRAVVLQDITRLKRRERELELLKQVQSRVLRHNIRNELTTVRGNAQLVERAVDGKHEKRVADMIEASESLLSISSKARVVEEVIEGSDETVTVDLRECAEAAIDAIYSEHPELEVSVSSPRECPAEAVPQLQTAIEILLENAAVHNDSDEPRARVELERGPRPQLTISDNGPGIPDSEIAVLQHAEETELEHGSGIGLWAVKWIVERSNAELSFETSEEGTSVTIQFAEREREQT